MRKVKVLNVRWRHHYNWARPHSSPKYARPCAAEDQRKNVVRAFMSFLFRFTYGLTYLAA